MPALLCFSKCLLRVYVLGSRKVHIRGKILSARPHIGRLIVAALVVLPGLAMAQPDSWVPMGRAANGDAYFWSPGTLKQDPAGYVKAWTKVVFAQPYTAKRRGQQVEIASEKVLQAVECGAQRMAALSGVEYSASGETVSTHNLPYNPERVEPNSVGAHVAEVICDAAKEQTPPP